MEFLLSMMELIIQDISISKVAEELNRKGFRTRKGAEWGPGRGLQYAPAPHRTHPAHLRHRGLGRAPQTSHSGLLNQIEIE
ncbi:MAG: hypothetical protein WAK30_11700, partial [Candidatus Acidiferrales bacterium]